MKRNRPAWSRPPAIVAAILVLIPVIVISGLLAVLAVPAVAISRRIRALPHADRPSHANGLAPVLALEPAPAEPSLTLASRRAA